MSFARSAITAIAVTSATSVLIAFGAGGCTHATSVTTRTAREPSAAQVAAAASVGVGAEELTELLNKPIYRMKPTEVGRYLSYLHVAEPDLRARVADLGRKNIGQPYELYLLGEFPYEAADDQPLFSLERSDCVVFAEHTYAMALSQSWEEFFWMLQRIRYKDGVIGVATRNHYTETDWNRQNAWLVKDISADLAGDRTATYTLVVDRSRFLKKRYKIDRDIPVETSIESYVPKEMVSEITSQLQPGDFVNVISGKDGDKWASHVGLVVAAANGERHFLHSSEPAVREETFASYIHRVAEREARNAAAGKQDKLLFGFKFLRLNDNPDVPPMAPQPRPRPPEPHPVAAAP
jgi:hypothetical protein